MSGFPGYLPDDDGNTAPSRVALVILPGTEDPAELLKRGGITMNWGRTQVRSFKEIRMPQERDTNLLLPPFYLQFLQARFLLRQGEGIPGDLRSGNDSEEVIMVCPTEDLTELANFEGGRFREVASFVETMGETMISRVSSNNVVSAQPGKLYYCLKTARPKAPISLDKASFGMPEEAEMYGFAQNHVGVSHMSPDEMQAFEDCIAELAQLDQNQQMQQLSVFLKLFFEGGFAYHKKHYISSTSSAYLPINVGIAALGTTPAFDGQSGISTGYPYLLKGNMLRFTDSVPVTIGAIRDFSRRHQRYGLCFTRSVFIWEGDDIREGVLNFSSVAPHGGFFYVPETLEKHAKEGGLVYAFGETRETLEAATEASVRSNE